MLQPNFLTSPPPGPGTPGPNEYCGTPNITSVIPDTWIAGQTYPIKIMGSGFSTDAQAAVNSNCPANQLTITVPTGTVTVTSTHVVSSTEIDATVQPANTDPDEQATLTLYYHNANDDVVRSRGGAASMVATAKPEGIAPTWGWVSAQPAYALINSLSAVITDTSNLENNIMTVKLTGPIGASGPLNVILTGSDQMAPSFTLGEYDDDNLVPGKQDIPLSFDQTFPGIYNSADGTWQATTLSGTDNVNIPNYSLQPWTYFRKIFYTQYNIPYENQCSGSDVTAYIVDNNCAVTPVQLNADFVAAAWLNGHGVENNGQVLFGAFGAGLGDTQKCAGKYPTGAIGHGTFDGNTFVKVSSLTGSCNTALVGNRSVAIPVVKGSDKKFHPSSLSGVVPLSCGQNLNLDSGNYSTAYTRVAADLCPICSNPSTFNGADGHIDSFSANQSCTEKIVGNLGSFYTSFPTK